MNPDSEHIKSKIIREFGTPCAVVDLDIVDKNIKRAQALCDAAAVHNRPHIKTHKSPYFAKLQIAQGAKGITCQKLGEAEIMVDEGISDIIVATNVIAAAETGRLSKLLKRAPVRCIADSSYTLNAYSKAAKNANVKIGVLIECDTGLQRAGVETPSEAIALAKLVKSDPWLKFSGLLFYPPTKSWANTQLFLNEVSIGLKKIDLVSEIVSTGGTPNFINLGKLKGATEHRAGTCIFNDRMMIESGVASLEDCALTIYTSVVSRAGKYRGIIDSGSKTLSSDTGDLDGFGLILEYPDAKIQKFAEEHGFVDFSNCERKPLVGDICRVVPNHVCVVVNLFNELVTVRNGRIEDVIEVKARGKLV